MAGGSRQRAGIPGGAFGFSMQAAQDIEKTEAGDEKYASPPHAETCGIREEWPTAGIADQNDRATGQEKHFDPDEDRCACRRHLLSATPITCSEYGEDGADDDAAEAPNHTGRHTADRKK
jgi:hypothetical protein